MCTLDVMDEATDAKLGMAHMLVRPMTSGSFGGFGKHIFSKADIVKASSLVDSHGKLEVKRH